MYFFFPLPLIHSPASSSSFLFSPFLQYFLLKPLPRFLPFFSLTPVPRFLPPSHSLSCYLLYCFNSIYLLLFIPLVHSLICSIATVPCSPCTFPFLIFSFLYSSLLLSFNPPPPTSAYLFPSASPPLLRCWFLSCLPHLLQLIDPFPLQVCSCSTRSE